MTTGNDIHTYETRNRSKFRTHQQRLNMFTNLSENAGIHLYNKLPDELQHISNVLKFKSKLKDYLLENAFYSVITNYIQFPYFSVCKLDLVKINIKDPFQDGDRLKCKN